MDSITADATASAPFSTTPLQQQSHQLMSSPEMECVSSKMRKQTEMLKQQQALLFLQQQQQQQQSAGRNLATIMATMTPPVTVNEATNRADPYQQQQLQKNLARFYLKKQHELQVLLAEQQKRERLRQQQPCKRSMHIHGQKLQRDLSSSPSPTLVSVGCDSGGSAVTVTPPRSGLQCASYLKERRRLLLQHRQQQRQRKSSKGSLNCGKRFKNWDQAYSTLLFFLSTYGRDPDCWPQHPELANWLSKQYRTTMDPSHVALLDATEIPWDDQADRNLAAKAIFMQQQQQQHVATIIPATPSSASSISSRSREAGIPSGSSQQRQKHNDQIKRVSIA